MENANDIVSVIENTNNERIDNLEVEFQKLLISINENNKVLESSLNANHEEIIKVFNKKIDILSKANKGIHSEVATLTDNLKETKYKINELTNEFKKIPNLQAISNEFKLIQKNIFEQFKNVGKQEFNTIIGLLTNNKQIVETERTISFQLGKTLLDGSKSVENLIRLPSKLFDLKKETENRKLVRKEKTILEDKVKKELTSNKVVNVEVKTESKELKSTKIFVEKNDNSKLNKNFSKALTLLDPISELCWQDGFPGFPITRNKFEIQIQNTTSDFAFFESAWKANKSQWLYAFNSPNLQHKNAQDLLKIIGLLRQKNIPILFWNKEDPMHYEMFKPIAKEADFVFTTDSLKVEQYKKDLGHNFVWALPFAAPIKITNPIDRFKLKTESICFAGTYYAKNHPDRKKQMDMLLPALLEFDGAIYDRASNSTSENYQYPEIYNKAIREGVDFDKMVTLYKKFKVFLNVNTITQSPTMMSRRVYELLASGTPVVSTPSKAITEQFPGIVLTVKNESEAKLAVQKLLTDSYFWHKQSVLGIREVMSKHTYEDRWLEIKSKMQNNSKVNTNNDAIRAVAIYHGYQDLNSFIFSIFEQTQNISELVIVKSMKCDVKSGDIDDLNKDRVKIKNINEFDINAYIKKEKEGYTFITTDIVMLFKNCVKDLLLSFKYHSGYAVSRKVVYDYNALNQKNDFSLGEGTWFSYLSQNDLNSLLVSNAHKDQIIIDLMKKQCRILNADNKLFLIDPFNIVKLPSELVSSASKKKHDQFKFKFESKLGI